MVLEIGKVCGEFGKQHCSLREKERDVNDHCLTLRPKRCGAGDGALTHCFFLVVTLPFLFEHLPSLWQWKRFINRFQSVSDYMRGTCLFPFYSSTLFVSVAGGIFHSLTGKGKI